MPVGAVLRVHQNVNGIHEVPLVVPSLVEERLDWAVPGGAYSAPSLFCRAGCLGGKSSGGAASSRQGLDSQGLCTETVT